MLQIDRMVIDDVGGNPVKLASAVLKQISNLKPPIPILEIAEAVDIYEIREESLSGLEGGLITPDDKSEGAILVNADRPCTRKRYTIGHELGHYLNPWHKATRQDGFRCSARDMAVEVYQPGDRALQMEVEANEFAAELLMPETLVRAALNRKAGVDIDHIRSIAKDFEVSREAFGRRYAAFHQEPIAIVFSKDGIIRYAKKNRSFPSLDMRSGDPLPSQSLSKRSSLPIGEVSHWDEIDAGVWLRNPKGRRVCEQTLAQHSGFRLTIVALDEETSDEYEGEDDLDWEASTFHRPKRRS